jgi:succinate dehydrogenase / fumarate reductase, cytochrome b subunit
MAQAIDRTAEKPTALQLASITKKALMAITGLAWFLYVILHLLGNLLLWAGAETYNEYAHKLVSNPLIYPAEIGLLVFLLVHVLSAWRVTNENHQARPQPYIMKATTGNSSFASRTMWYGGVLLLLFIIIHVWMFKFGHQAGEQGLWGLVVRSFKNPLITLGYILAMIPLGLHLSHGFASALQTLSAMQPRWHAGLRKAGKILGWVLAIGYILLPIWALFIAEV